MAALEFQVLNWQAGDKSDSSSDSDGDSDARASYVVELFGKTLDGRSVYLQSAFEPCFFVELKAHSHSRLLLEKASDKAGDEFVSKKSGVVKRQKLYGFTNSTQFNFLKLVFSSHKAARKVAWQFENVHHLQLYESNVDPLLRFMHLTGVKPTGWVTVPAGCYHELEDTVSSCDLEWQCHYSDVHAGDTQGVAPFVLVSLI